MYCGDMAHAVSAATLFGVAVVFGLLGYLIRLQRRLSLAAAHSRASTTDRASAPDHALAPDRSPAHDRSPTRTHSPAYDCSSAPDRAPDSVTLATFGWRLSFFVSGLTVLLGVAVALDWTPAALWSWYTALVVAAVLVTALGCRVFDGSGAERETADDF